MRQYVLCQKQSLTHQLPKLLIKPLIHHIATVVEHAVEVVLGGVAELEFPKGLIKLLRTANYLVVGAELQIPLSGEWNFWQVAFSRRLMVFWRIANYLVF